MFILSFSSFSTTCTIHFPKPVCTNNISIRRISHALYAYMIIAKSRRLGLKNLSCESRDCIFAIFFFSHLVGSDLALGVQAHNIEKKTSVRFTFIFTFHHIFFASLRIVVCKQGTDSRVGTKPSNNTP